MPHTHGDASAAAGTRATAHNITLLRFMLRDSISLNLHIKYPSMLQDSSDSGTHTGRLRARHQCAFAYVWRASGAPVFVSIRVSAQMRTLIGRRKGGSPKETRRGNSARSLSEGPVTSRLHCFRLFFAPSLSCRLSQIPVALRQAERAARRRRRPSSPNGLPYFVLSLPLSGSFFPLSFSPTAVPASQSDADFASNQLAMSLSASRSLGNLNSISLARRSPCH